jgi:2-amino-4-hydroxy-6-hydroxymethyldihydropteridine diphosphokinase
MQSSGKGKQMADIFLALGSNIGDRKDNLIEAMKLLGEKVDVEKLSSVYETEPVGYSKQPFFLNAVLKGATALKPPDLLKFLKDIENRLGRKPTFPNGPRTIDIDILFYDNKILNSNDLVIPHPRLTVRAFVLVPLNEIAPDFIHPGNERPVSQLVKDLGNISGLHWWAESEQIWTRR